MFAVAREKRCNKMTLVCLSTRTIANVACERTRRKANGRDERANVFVSTAQHKGSQRRLSLHAAAEEAIRLSR